MPRLLDKVCVVNGAASTIGQAVVERFISDGAVVVGVDTAEGSVGHHAVQANLADEAQVEAMYQEVVGQYGRLDVIYNKHGAYGSARRLGAGHEPGDVATGAGCQPDQHLPRMQARHPPPAGH